MEPKDLDLPTFVNFGKAGTSHSLGFNVVLADGSVRFISRNIDPQVLQSMATMAGGEVFQLD